MRIISNYFGFSWFTAHNNARECLSITSFAYPLYCKKIIVYEEFNIYDSIIILSHGKKEEE